MAIRFSLVLAVLVTCLVAPRFAAPANASVAHPKPLGEVLSQEEVPRSKLPTGAARGVRLLYTTRDQNGRRVNSGGVVYLPAGRAPAGGWKVVSWAHGTTGISPNCAPSGMEGSYLDENEPPVAAALKSGYVVTATDYPGVGAGGAVAEYLAGRAAAYSVLDMVRAAREVSSDISHTWVSSGHSQGGDAAIWAAHLAPSYASDLDLRGTVAYAPASNIESVMPAFNPVVGDLGRANTMGSFLLYIVAGLDHVRPDLHVLDHLTPSGRRWLERARTTCVLDLAEQLASVPIGSLVAHPFTDDESTAAIRDYLTVPPNGYTRPVRIEHGLTDITVPYPLSLTLSAQMRAAGTAVELVSYRGINHSRIVHRAVPDADAAIARYFASV
ncbi:lipase family protein [Gordonia sputi]